MAAVVPRPSPASVIAGDGRLAAAARAGREALRATVVRAVATSLRTWSAGVTRPVAWLAAPLATNALFAESPEANVSTNPFLDSKEATAAPASREPGTARALVTTRESATARERAGKECADEGFAAEACAEAMAAVAAPPRPAASLPACAAVARNAPAAGERRVASGAVWLAIEPSRPAVAGRAVLATIAGRLGSMAADASATGWAVGVSRGLAPRVARRGAGAMPGPLSRLHCHTPALTNSSRASAASQRRRARRRSCGAATGSGSWARMLAHSGAGGSWP